MRVRLACVRACGVRMPRRACVQAASCVDGGRAACVLRACCGQVACMRWACVACVWRVPAASVLWACGGCAMGAVGVSVVSGGVR